MLRLVIPPAPALKHVLRHILVVEMDGGCASVPVIFSPMICLTVRGSAYLKDAQGQHINVPAYILQGPSPLPQRVYYKGRTLMISVCFCTGMLQHSAGIAMERVLNTYPELSSVFNPRLCEILQQQITHQVQQFEQQHGHTAASDEALALRLVAEFQHYLLGILKPVQHTDFARGLVAARDKLFVPLAQLANFFGIGERQLERRLRKVFGFSLRDLRRIARFGHCMPLLLAQGHGWGDLTQIAQEAGYYDQAHMYRDFIDLAGINPAQLLQQIISKNPEFWLYQFELHDFAKLFLAD